MVLLGYWELTLESILAPLGNPNSTAKTFGVYVNQISFRQYRERVSSRVTGRLSCLSMA